MNELIADVVLIAHALFAAFIVAGLAAIAIGAWRRWRWVRNPWFRVAHLAAIGIVVLQAWLDLTCPLTILESELRLAAGGSGYPQRFIPYWVHRLLFYEAPAWVFTLAYSAFALAVAAVWIGCPPAFRRRDRAPDGSR
jgi:hypothetical protein